MHNKDNTYCGKTNGIRSRYEPEVVVESVVKSFLLVVDVVAVVVLVRIIPLATMAAVFIFNIVNIIN